MEFGDVGNHCAVESCHRQDFLPYTCDRCSKVFCLQHYRANKHDCEVGDADDVQAILCPLCNKTIRFRANQNPDKLWDDHFLNECTQEQPSEEDTKRTCTAPGCKTRITPSNHITCSTCHAVVCLPHRRAEDHQCDTVKRLQLSRAASLRRVNSSDVFECPFCAMRFLDSPSLSAHVDEVHQEGKESSSSSSSSSSNSSSSSGGFLSSLIPSSLRSGSAPPPSSSSGLEPCPFCGLQCDTESILMTHIQNEHS